MFELYLALLLALLTLYNTTMLNSTGNRKKIVEMELNRYATRIIVSFTFITFVYLLLSAFESINLLLLLAGKTTLSLKFLDVVMVLYLLAIIGCSYILFASHRHFKMLVPQINLPNLLIVQGLTVFWIYLNIIRTEFSQIAYTVSISLSGIFTISVFLSIYVMYLLSKYFSLLRKGHLLENIDFYPFILKLNLALTLFGFAMLSKFSQGCISIICNIMLAGHAILMNHTLSELGRAVKRNIGMG